MWIRLLFCKEVLHGGSSYLQSILRSRWGLRETYRHNIPSNRENTKPIVIWHRPLAGQNILQYFYDSYDREWQYPSQRLPRLPHWLGAPSQLPSSRMYFQCSLAGIAQPSFSCHTKSKTAWLCLQITAQNCSQPHSQPFVCAFYTVEIEICLTPHIVLWGWCEGSCDGAFNFGASRKPSH